MPKRTKKEKILALYRKRLKLIESQSVKPQPSPSQITVQIPVSGLTEKHKEESLPDDSPVRKYFMKDLKKSLLIITGIFALEFAIYFVKLIK